MAQWTQGNIMILIDLYRSYPLLWDPRHEDFHNAAKKDEAWQEIADSLEVLKEECRKKMESLKGSYRREKGKIKRSSLQGQGEPYRSRWFAFSAMQFLEEKSKRRETIIKTEPENSSPGSERAAEPDADGRDSQLSCYAPDMCLYTQNSNEAEDMEDAAERPAAPHKEPEGYKPVKMAELKRKREDPDQWERSGQDRPDECAAFGSYVANKLKRYNDRERAIAQHRIGNVFFEIDMLLHE